MIVPRPLFVEHTPGGFTLLPTTVITFSAPDPALIQPVLLHLQRQIALQLHFPDLAIEQASQPAAAPSLHLLLSPAVAEEVRQLPHSEEAYVLTCGDENAEAGVLLAAASPAGLRYGVQSLLQLLPSPPAGAAPEPVRLPGLRIVDAPRFGWRGVMLDCGRHFLSVPCIKRVLDAMLAYKFNRFHWHLTEDQGWRLEVQQFPRLTEVGAWRQGEAGRYGGFYTQEEVREVVAYAAERGISVLPEIEMPGHCVAALAAYPHLSCTGEVAEVSNHWGVHDDVFCAGRDEVFSFLEVVLQEVLDLFPSHYIHVGGDEVPKLRWSECPRCQERMRAEGLADEEELQAWFLARVNAFLRCQGRQLVGWDEILEGGLCEGAVVMSWRGIGGGVAAARAGHDVVMSPTQHCYFDYRQAPDQGEPGAWYAVLSLRQVYDFDPVPPEPQQQHHHRSSGAADEAAGRAASVEPMALDEGSEPEEGAEVEADDAVGSGGAKPLQQQQQPVAAEAGTGVAEAATLGAGLEPTVLPPPRPVELPAAAAAVPAAAAAVPAAAAAAPAVAAEGRSAEGRSAEGRSAEGHSSPSAKGAGASSSSEGSAGRGPGLNLTAEEAKHVLGGQANLWTEYVGGDEVAEYMLLPRMCAMAEALWSPRGQRNWADFCRRLRAHEPLWRRLGMRYRPLEN